MDWSTSHPGLLNLTWKSSGTHWAVFSFGSRTDLNTSENRKICCSCWESNNLSAVIVRRLVTILTGIFQPQPRLTVLRLIMRTSVLGKVDICDVVPWTLTEIYRYFAWTFSKIVWRRGVEYPEDSGGSFLWNVCRLLPEDMKTCPTRQYSSPNTTVNTVK
jgi:hypothetical protein